METEGSLAFNAALKTCGTQAELARRLETTRQHVAYWKKHGPPKWRLDALRKVARSKR